MESKPEAILVAISGPSCSGKTTLARLLCEIYDNAFILHEDDFYKPDREIPITNGVQDWDCLESLQLAKLKSALVQIHATGQLPSDLDSKEDQNHSSTAKLKDPSAVSRWFQRFQSDLGPEKPRMCIVDGFLLYSGRMKEVRDELDLKFFVTIDHDTMKQRREGRAGYVTIEGFWEDPPGYVDDIVWPHYVEDHRYLFQNSDVEDEVDLEECFAVGIHPLPSGAGYDLDAALEAICQVTLEYLRSSS